MKVVKYEDSPYFLEPATIWTGSMYQGITIWSSSLSKIKNIDEVKEISCIVQVGELIWCGSLDGSVSIYHHKTYKRIDRLEPASPVRFMELVRDVMWVCTDDFIIRYNVQKRIVIFDPIPVGRTNSLVFIHSKNQIWGASSDHSIYIWNSDVCTHDLIRRLFCRQFFANSIPRTENLFT